MVIKKKSSTQKKIIKKSTRTINFNTSNSHGDTSMSTVRPLEARIVVKPLDPETVPDGNWAELLTIPTGNNVVTCTDPDTTPPPNAAVGILPVFKYCPDNLSGIHVSKKVFYIHIMPSR